MTRSSGASLFISYFASISNTYDCNLNLIITWPSFAPSAGLLTAGCEIACLAGGYRGYTIRPFGGASGLGWWILNVPMCKKDNN